MFLKHLIFPSRKLTQVFSAISFACCIWVFAVFMVTPSKKQFPQNLFFNIQLYISLCFCLWHFKCLLLSCFIISITGLLPSFFGGNEFLCHNGKVSTSDYAPCAVQGMLNPINTTFFLKLFFYRCIVFVLWTCCFMLVVRNCS